MRTSCSVAILLATYNSEKYLKDLFVSLLNQTFTDFVIYIRDDGSVDNTFNICSDFQLQFPDKIQFIIDDLKNVGPHIGFLKLLENVNCNYYMFCDHDDIWLPDKIQKTFLKMKETEFSFPDIPILIHTDLYVVDQYLNVISSSFRSFSGKNIELQSKFNYLGISNCAVGCTIMINANAKNVCLPFSKNLIMHDWWVALKVSKVGRLEYISDATILYRQHSSNTLGAIEFKTIGIFKKMISFISLIKYHYLVNKMLKDLKYGGFFKYVFYKTIFYFKHTNNLQEKN